jgi:hypothetical protein
MEEVLEQQVKQIFALNPKALVSRIELITTLAKEIVAKVSMAFMAVTLRETHLLMTLIQEEVAGTTHLTTRELVSPHLKQDLRSDCILRKLSTQVWKL